MYKRHTIWLWEDDEGITRHVGHGPFHDIHPARMRWDCRYEGDSELDTWLQACEKEPKRVPYGPPLVSKEMALAAVGGLRARFAGDLLKARGPSSYSGGHPARSVFFFAGDIESAVLFPSVREAARATGVNASSITRWCKDDKTQNWGYFEDDF